MSTDRRMVGETRGRFRRCLAAATTNWTQVCLETPAGAESFVRNVWAVGRLSAVCAWRATRAGRGLVLLGLGVGVMDRVDERLHGRRILNRSDHQHPAATVRAPQSVDIPYSRELRPRAPR